MFEYLQQIKSISDTLTAISSPLDTEDLILYTLNGLPANYHAFKTAIRTRHQPITIEELHSLLHIEEQSLQLADSDTTSQLTTTTLAAAKSKDLPYSLCRGRGSSFIRG